MGRTGANTCVHMHVKSRTHVSMFSLHSVCFLKASLFIYVCLFVRMCIQVCKCLRRPEERVGCPGVEFTVIEVLEDQQASLLAS